MARNPSHETNSFVSTAVSRTVLASDDIILVTATSTMTFPLANSVAAGKTFTFLASGATTITFTAAGSDTFPTGKAVVNADGEYGTFLSDGVSKWYTIAGLIA